MFKQSMIENLESRTLMSAAPPLFDTPVKADRAVIRAELNKFKVDLAFCAAKLKADGKAMAREGLAQVPNVGPLVTTLKTDIQAQRTALKEDRLAESAAALADESVIKLDIRQILIDKKNTSAEMTDHAKLRTDRATLQGDLIAGLDSRIATRTADKTMIMTDADAIVAAVTADTSASAGLVAATSKFSLDERESLTRFTIDLTNIANARTTLMNDLTAEQAT